MKKSEDKNPGWFRGEFMKRLVIAAVAAVAAAALLSLYAEYRNDPNLFYRWHKRIIEEDETVQVSYHYNDYSFVINRKRIPLFIFTPEEEGDYTFAVSDIASEEGEYLYLSVMDTHFNDYYRTDNSNNPADDFSGTVFLSGESTCYVVVSAMSDSDSRSYSGSFSLTVSRAEEEILPEELTLSEPVTIKVGTEQQTSVLFRPEETGFYRFSSAIVSGDDTGSSYIDSIMTSDNETIKQAQGICRLEGGEEYYVWVSANDLSGRSADVDVSCSRVATLEADDFGSYSITEDTIIEYTAPGNVNTAVYSESDGNMRSSVYDSKGFPVNSDDNSGEALSGNDKDFALVIPSQKKKNRYLIYCAGKFKKCNIMIAKYIGDGTTLGSDDIELLHEEQTDEMQSDDEQADENQTDD